MTTIIPWTNNIYTWTLYRHVPTIIKVTKTPPNPGHTDPCRPHVNSVPSCRPIDTCGNAQQQDEAEARYQKVRHLHHWLTCRKGIIQRRWRSTWTLFDSSLNCYNVHHQERTYVCFHHYSGELQYSMPWASCELHCSMPWTPWTLWIVWKNINWYIYIYYIFNYILNILAFISFKGNFRVHT